MSKSSVFWMVWCVCSAVPYIAYASAPKQKPTACVTSIGEEAPQPCHEDDKEESPSWGESFALYKGVMVGAQLNIPPSFGAEGKDALSFSSIRNVELRVGYDGLSIGKLTSLVLFVPELEVQYMRGRSEGDEDLFHLLNWRVGGRIHSGIVPWYAPYAHVGRGRFMGVPGWSYEIGMALMAPFFFLAPFKVGMQIDYNVLRGGLAHVERVSWIDAGFFFEWTFQRN